MGDFREKFGLDWLRGQERTDLPPEMHDAIVAYSRQLLEALKNAPNETSKLFDLAKNLKLRLDAITPVVKYLVGRYYIRVTEPDELGNDTLMLTREGEKLLGA